MVHGVALGEIEERVMLQQRILEVVALRRVDFDVGRDSPAAVNGAATVSKLYFAIAVSVAVFFSVAIVIVVVERYTGVVALNQATAWRVVLCRGQRQAGVLGQGIDGLHQ